MQALDEQTWWHDEGLVRPVRHRFSSCDASDLAQNAEAWKHLRADSVCSIIQSCVDLTRGPLFIQSFLEE